ncbi:winged helix-turn-helix domain-containing protein [Duganella aceris]|uniref:Helix-turn-helix transcriptional regulator n=1 Tax=Duganella aceris TaxID=2703883 RepID=A0ABX0FPG3_9BURK|nr:winged helix-turn-helix domain-containing protein [Duganella aceris]NGZ86340.1 helix-turn-helix transcriptional regulator [Duganella aceris]
MSLPDVSPAPGYAARYTFLDFELLPCERALLHGDCRVALGSRAYDVLLALVERAGRLVTKEELIGVVWPDTIVEEGNLRVQISALRKALREEQHGQLCIENLARRGYVFTAPVRRHDGAASPAADAAPAVAARTVSGSAQGPAHRPMHGAAQGQPQETVRGSVRGSEGGPLQSPMAYGALVGRDGALRELAALLLERRHVVVTGAAGVGKSVLAAAVVALLGTQYDLPCCLLDAAACADPGAALRAIAAACRLPNAEEEDAAQPTHRLRAARLVLLLDGCDHAPQAAAALIARLRAALPEMLLLTTSRGPLRLAQESVYPLPPLALPPRDAVVTPALAYAAPAVRLFCDRARARCQDFIINAREVDTIVAICRELDGIPLALELAALSMDLLSPSEVLARLQERFQLLASARRSPVARHQTMWAALEWGFERLSPEEKIVLRRLAIFRDGFTACSAAALACCHYISLDSLLTILPALVDKSLLLTDQRGDHAGYRMHHTIRAHALKKLRTANDPMFPPAALPL